MTMKAKTDKTAKTEKARKAATIALAKAIAERKRKADQMAKELHKGYAEQAEPATNHKANLVHGFDVRSLPESGTKRLYRKVKTPLHNPGPLPVVDQFGAANPEGHFERHTLTRPDRVIAKDGSRRGVEKQIAAIKWTIQDNLKRLRHALNRGQDDTAMRYCAVIVKLRGNLLGLVEQAKAIQDAEPIRNPDLVPRKPKTTTKVKQKRYPRWSDK